MRFKTVCFWVYVTTAVFFKVCAQKISKYNVEVGSIVSSDQTPFWLRANQYGTIPLKNPLGRLNIAISSDYTPVDSTVHRRKTDWGYGLDAVINAGVTSKVLFSQAYLKGRFGAFELYVGRRREIVGLVDTLLTTGAYAWSGNALPIPKVQLAIPVFTPLPFTKGVFSILGAFAHGWFENSGRLVQGSYLHQKYLYGRIGKPTWPFRLYGGFNHQVIWAGHSDYLSQYVAVNGQLPSSIKYYPAVVFGTRGTQPNGIDVSSFEDNRIGNQLGSVDLAIDVDIQDWNLYVYRQFLYDDGSLFYGTNIQDGLNGLRIKNQRIPAEEGFFLRQITFEYLFTGSQGGDEFVIDDPQRRGRDDYFNHSQFIDGWTYFGRTIGTPFITPLAEARHTLPARTGIVNNRVSAFHVGLNALVNNKVELTTRLSLSRNAGTYPLPFVRIPTQFSGLLTASVPLNLLGGATLNGSFAVDAGGLLPNSVGGYLGIKKTGILGGRANTAPSKPFMRFH